MSDLDYTVVADSIIESMEDIDCALSERQETMLHAQLALFLLKIEMNGLDQLISSLSAYRKKQVKQ